MPDIDWQPRQAISSCRDRHIPLVVHVKNAVLKWLFHLRIWVEACLHKKIAGQNPNRLHSYHTCTWLFGFSISESDSNIKYTWLSIYLMNLETNPFGKHCLWGGMKALGITSMIHISLFTGSCIHLQVMNIPMWPLALAGWLKVWMDPSEKHCLRWCKVSHLYPAFDSLQGFPGQLTTCRKQNRVVKHPITV